MAIFGVLWNLFSLYITADIFYLKCAYHTPEDWRAFTVKMHYPCPGPIIQSTTHKSTVVKNRMNNVSDWCDSFLFNSNNVFVKFYSILILKHHKFIWSKFTTSSSDELQTATWYGKVIYKMFSPKRLDLIISLSQETRHFGTTNL